MNAQKIQAELAEQVAGILSKSPLSIDPNAPLHTLGLDSMRMVEIILFIEKQYGVDLMASGLKREDVASIAALTRTVERRQAS